LSAIKETRPIKHPTTMVGEKRRRGEKEGEEGVAQDLSNINTCLHLPHATRRG